MKKISMSHIYTQIYRALDSFQRRRLNGESVLPIATAKCQRDVYIAKVPFEAILWRLGV